VGNDYILSSDFVFNLAGVNRPKNQENFMKGNFGFATTLLDTLKKYKNNCPVMISSSIQVALDNPYGKSKKAGENLKYILEVARTIGKNMNKYLVVVTKSTVPVGTAKKVKATIQGELDKCDVQILFDVASNPEFLKEGTAVSDFMNDIANLCALVGADVNMVRRGIGSDSRIGNKFLYAGCGYGGSCFPKDVKALIKTAEHNGYDMNVLKAVEQVNSCQKGIIFRKLRSYYSDSLKGKKIALWGLSFKAGTDDILGKWLLLLFS